MVKVLEVTTIWDKKTKLEQASRVVLWESWVDSPAIKERRSRGKSA